MAIGLWLRRGIDGTLDELWAALRDVMQTYDPEWLASPAGTSPPGTQTAAASATPERVIRVDASTGSGQDTFDSDDVMRAVRQAQPSINECYAKLTRAGEQHEGRLIVRFAVEPGGAVRQIDVLENKTGSEAVAECVTRNLRGIRFEPGPRGSAVTFRYPFVFRPR